MLANLGKGLLACHFHKMMTNTSISYEKAGHVIIELGGSDQKGMVTLQVQDRHVFSPGSSYVLCRSSYSEVNRK